MPGKMHAVMIHRKEKGAITYTDDVPIPEPGPGEVLIKVKAAAICGSDRHLYNWDPSTHTWVEPPRVIGHEFCGEIAETGPDCPIALRVGDYVSAEMHEVCGRCQQCRTGNKHICQNTIIYGYQKDGCFAEYVKVPAYNVIPLPGDAVPVKVGAFLDALGNAVHVTQKVKVAGRSVLVTGYGPIGAMTASLAHFLGASAVFISDVGPYQLEHARTWARGATEQRPGAKIRIFDVGQGGDEAVEEIVLRETDGGADVVFEMSGAEPAINDGLRVLKNGGELVLLGIPGKKDITIRDYGKNVIFKGLTIHSVIGRQMYGTWYEMIDLLKAGLDVEHVVTEEFPLSEFTQAIETFDSGQSLKVVMYP